MHSIHKFSGSMEQELKPQITSVDRGKNRVPTQAIVALAKP